MTCIEMAIQLIIAAFSAATTLAAAYFGAKFAFDFQNRKDEVRRVAETIKAANMAIFALMRSHHELTAVKLQYIDPNVDDEDRHFSILPSSSPVPHLNLEFNQLSYLLSSSDPNLLNELALVQSEINATIDVVNARSKFHITEFQPLLDNHIERVRQASGLEELEIIVGERVTLTLKSTTDSVIQSIPDAMMILATTVDKLHKATKAMFPDQGVVRMTFRKTEPEALTMRSSRNCIATPATWHKEHAMCPATRCNSA
jgi:hypothetical protein